MSTIQPHPVSGERVLRTTAHEPVLRQPVKAFEVHPWLRNPHLMTVLAEYWPRNLSALPQPSERLFEVEAETRLLAKCHWQAMPRRHPTLVLVHGLEGSSESRYMFGMAGKAFAAGFNVLRLNQRNCGGTDHLTPTLYESGLSRDYRAVLEELIEKDRLPEIFFTGYSMGGNLVTKWPGSLAPTRRQNFGVSAPFARVWIWRHLPMRVMSRQILSTSGTSCGGSREECIARPSCSGTLSRRRVLEAADDT